MLWRDGIRPTRSPCRSNGGSWDPSYGFPSLPPSSPVLPFWFSGGGGPMVLFDSLGVICRVRREDEEGFLWSEEGWDPVGYPASRCCCPIVRVAVEGSLRMEGLMTGGSLPPGKL